MSGVIPPTKYLLVNLNTIVGEFDSRYEIAAHLGVDMNDEGVIQFIGKPVSPSYIMRDWKKHEAIRDWAVYHMGSNLPPGYKIYRFII